MESEEYYLKLKWQNLYKTCSTTIEQDRFLIQSVLAFPKLITCAGKLSEEEEIWIWNDIAAHFNETRFNNKRMNWFATDLKSRFNLLKPLVLAQTNVLECSPLTQEMLTDIKRMTTISGSNQAQVLLSSNLSWILKLPEKQRLSLEADIFELLRNLELRALGLVKCLSHDDFEKIAEDCAQEFENMGLNNLPDIQNEKERTKPMKTHASAKSTPVTTKKEDAADTLLMVPRSMNIKTEEVRTPTTPNKGVHYELLKRPTRAVKSKTQMEVDTKMPLLKCIPPRFIPIKDAHLYIRECVVRVKRIQPINKRIRTRSSYRF